MKKYTRHLTHPATVVAAVALLLALRPAPPGTIRASRIELVRADGSTAGVFEADEASGWIGLYSPDGKRSIVITAGDFDASLVIRGNAAEGGIIASRCDERRASIQVERVDRGSFAEISADTTRAKVDVSWPQNGVHGTLLADGDSAAVSLSDLLFRRWFAVKPADDFAENREAQRKP